MAQASSARAGRRFRETTSAAFWTPSSSHPGFLMAETPTDVDRILRTFAQKATTAADAGTAVCLREIVYNTRFRFFVRVLYADKGQHDEESFVRTFFYLCSEAILHFFSNGSNHALDRDAIHAILTTDGQHITLIFTTVVVNAYRALRLHAFLIHYLHKHMPISMKRFVFGNLHARQFDFFNQVFWEKNFSRQPYIDERGVNMIFSTNFVPCPSTSHEHCGSPCDGRGYIAQGEPTRIWACMSNPVDAESVVFFDVLLQRFANDPILALQKTSLRVPTEAMTEPFISPIGAPVVPLQEDRRTGRKVLTDCFEVEKYAYRKVPDRQWFDLSTTDLTMLETIEMIVRAASSVHRNFTNIGLTSIYKQKDNVYVNSTSTYCPKADAYHECRARFIIFSHAGRPSIQMECFHPDCKGARGERYCSVPVALPSTALAQRLGIRMAKAPISDRIAMLDEQRARLDAQRHGEDLPGAKKQRKAPMIPDSGL